MKIARPRGLPYALGIILLITIFYYTAYSEEPTVGLTGGVQQLHGNSTYKIGFSSLPATANDLEGFPISELKFPLNVYLLSVSGNLSFQRWQMNLALKKKLTQRAGIMKDSDWRYDAGMAIPANYSENKTHLNAFVVDGVLLYNFLRKANWSFGGGIGYLAQSFGFSTTNIMQQDFAEPSAEVYTVAGPFIDYDIEYSIPYLQGKINYCFKEGFALAAEFGYSFLVKVKDYDYHLKAKKTSFGTCDGDAYLFSLQAMLHKHNAVVLIAECTYMMIDTKGEQTELYDYEISTTSTRYNETIASKQLALTVSIGYEF